MKEIARLERAGVKLAWNAQISDIRGDGRVEAATVSGVGGDVTIEVDTVLLGGHFTSSNELSRLLGCAHRVTGNGTLTADCAEDGESSLPHIHIVGEAVRFGGAHLAMAEGRLAGLAIAAKLGLKPQTDTTTKKKLARAKAFQAALWRLFAPAPTPLELADTVLACRCESVAIGTLKSLAVKGPLDIATMKRLTRAGMGRCQSRYCGRTLTELTGRPTADATTSGAACGTCD